MQEFTKGLWDWRVEESGEKITIYPLSDKDSAVGVICHRSSREDIGNAVLMAHAPAMYYLLEQIAYQLGQGEESKPEYIQQIVADIKNRLQKINHSEKYKSVKEYMMCELLKQCLTVIEPQVVIEKMGLTNRYGEEIHREISLVELVGRIKKFLGITADTEVKS